MFRKLIFCTVTVCAIIPTGAAYARVLTYTAHHASEPAVSPDQGRIYFYRESSFAGMALEPSIRIDGFTVGESSSGDYFYVDRLPGTYTVSTKTEKDETLSVTLAAGQTIYVKTEVSMGFLVGHVSPELVANDQAAGEIADCHFDGTDTAATAAAPSAPAATPAATAAPVVQPAAAPTATATPPATSPQN
jgi:hypothetical protein